MRVAVLPLSALAISLAAVRAARADEPDPRVVIEKALKAMGGGESLRKIAAMRTRYEVREQVVGVDDARKFKGELHFQHHRNLSKFRFAADGHVFGFKYQLAENVQAGVKYYLNEKNNSTSEDDYQLLQADLVFKF